MDFESAVARLHADSVEVNPFLPFEKDSVSTSSGTAFFIDEKYLLTCFHCVENAIALSLSFPSRSKHRYPVKVVACLPFIDLALLAVADGCPEHASLSLSPTTAKPLDTVVALGYPLDSDNLKYTQGVVSGTHDEFIQMDAPINPGNSGGPLLKEGQVIGVNSQKLVNAEATGFAVPVRAYQVWEEYIKSTYADRPLLLRPFNLRVGLCNMNEEVIALLKTKGGAGAFPANSGVLVTITDREELKKGDIIFAANGNVVDNFGYMVNRFGERVPFLKSLLFMAVGDKLILSVFRKQVGTINVEIHFDDQPVARGIQEVYTPWEEPKYVVLGGIVFMELNQKHLNSLPYIEKISAQARVLLFAQSVLHRYKSVVFVSALIVGSPLAGLENIQPGQVVTAINGTRVDTVESVERALDNPREPGFLMVQTATEDVFVYPYNKLLSIDEELQKSYKYRSWDARNRGYQGAQS